MKEILALPKHIHIIGICGVATSALAIAFHEKGVRVTGSDKGFFPPVSTELEKHDIDFYAGWHPEKMVGENTDKEMLDFVMIGGTGTSPNNPETIYANENKIPVYSYAEVLQKYFIKRNSIVVTGTWGKTTSSALLSFIMEQAGMKPSYFTGGLSLSHPTGALSDSDWSVVEGDEYQVSISDKRPKFVYYSPTHLLLTSVSWDHADLYPTEKDYFAAFEKLVKGVPESGLIVACIDDEGVNKVLKSTGAKIDEKATTGGKAKIVTYGKDDKADYCFHSVTYTKKGLHFQLSNRDVCYEIVSPMLGRFNVENITGAFAMAHSIGIPADKIIQAIKDFKGIKRRFEKRLDGDAPDGNSGAKSGVTVLDCHAPTPEKAASVLASVREVYDGKIIAVYEPNIGGRQRETADKYDEAFKDADMVIIPRLTRLKVANEQDPTTNDQTRPMEGEELFKTISKTHKDCAYLPEDEEIIKFLLSQSKKGDVIVFLGSHGFRGMIEETVKKLGN